MKAFTLVCLALMITSTLSVFQVQPKVTCACAQIQFQSDCQSATALVDGVVVSCLWTPNANATGIAAKGTCSTPAHSTPDAVPASLYCNSITILACPCNRINYYKATLGCATMDGKTCNAFTGCSAYLQTTDELCQAISTQCTSDGVQCMPKAPCSSYLVSQCMNSSSSGSGKCKVINDTCVDQLCSDITTLPACRLISSCFWNGVTCLQNITTCDMTSGTSSTCPQITGLDGPCKYISGPNCTVKTCFDAPSSYNTKIQCIIFMNSCLFTTGKGCTTNLSSCSKYLQSNICSGYIGTDGPCVNDTTSATLCRAQQCFDAPSNFNTDSDCNIFKTGCVTTGKGCTQVRGACAAYLGTTITCESYIGSDGNCKGLSATNADTCAAKVCTDNFSASTDSECKQFQIGCITNGRGCVASLQKCSTYTIAPNSPCDGLIGSDGNCTAGSGANCVPRTCSAATQNTTTNSGCQAYSSTCISNGSQCIAQSGNCESQPTVMQCQGQSACLIGYICNDNTSCASYLTQSMCTLNKAGTSGYLRSCHWNSESNKCTDKSCTTLTGSSYNTDSACNSTISGCVYSGVTTGGCVESNAGCSAFYGTNANSSLCALVMKGTCWGTSSNYGLCAARACNLYQGDKPTSDLFCSTFLSTCVSDGNNACIIPTTCSGYNGSAGSCRTIRSNTDVGPYAQYPCMPTTPNQTSGACKRITCADIVIGSSPWDVVTSSQCSTELINCTTSSISGNGKQCIEVQTGQSTSAVSTSKTPTTTTVTDCTANTTASSDKECEAFWPSLNNKPVNFNCKWNGGKGCIASGLKSCIEFTGTIDSCPRFTEAIDSPCKGIGTNSDSCVPSVCSDAPISLSTDSGCNSFKAGCVTTGNGCQSRSFVTIVGCQAFINQSSCIASTLGGSGTNTFNTCTWAAVCLTSMPQCSSVLTRAACRVNLVVKTNQNPLGTCSWYIDNSGAGYCRDTTCADLPTTLTTDKDCSAMIPTCTTNGAGCVTKGACTTYLNSQTCTSAVSADIVTKCIWFSRTGCRMQKCSDNATSISDADCNINGLRDCRTTGVGCILASELDCSRFSIQMACIKDGNNQPCLWIQGQCRSYIGCNSIAWTTHAQCQQILTGGTTRPQCTSDGTKCQPLNSCNNYGTAKASCVIGNDGQTCGILPAESIGNTTYKCQKFGSCQDARGSTNAICQQYGVACISNGVGCQSISNCASYTQTACVNLGTDGTCIWSSTEKTCRTQTCSDAITNNTTDAECARFPAPYVNACTSNGTNCIKKSACASYMIQKDCVLGSDRACFWVTSVTRATTGTCRVKECTDLMSTTTAGCQNQIIYQPATTSSTGTIQAKYLDCVSNGTNCINKIECVGYTNLVSCSGKGSGLDGTCTFTPGASPTIGTCKLVRQCTDAGTDQIACSYFSDRCQSSQVKSGNSTSYSCIPHDCVSKANGSTCQPIPSWDYSTYTLCVPASSINSTCQVGDGSQLTQASCSSGTLKTHTWNDTQSACIYCGGAQVAESTSASNSSNNTNSSSIGPLIKLAILSYGALLATY